jgi:hypothetical protein
MLSGSWLFGLGLLYPAEPAWWYASLAVGVALLAWGGSCAERLCGSDAARTLAQAHAATVAVVLLPAAWLIPWPYKMGVILAFAGCLIAALPLRGRLTRAIVLACVAAGVVLTLQAMALVDYAHMTARSHDVPAPFPAALGWIARLMGAEVAVDGSTVVLHTARQMHPMAVTWQWLVDPASLLFLVGGVAAAGIAAWFHGPAGGRWALWLRAARTLTVVMLAWLPIRAALLAAVYVHRVVRSDPTAHLHAMNHFFSPWMLLLLLLVPALVLGRLLRTVEALPASAGDDRPATIVPPRAAPWWGAALGAALMGLAGFIVAWAALWSPAGERKAGRVVFVERKSEWEPTTQPYDTAWYVEPKIFDEGSGYNYAVIYDWLSHYYETSRLMPADKIDRQTLADCDVLVIKTPTERYTTTELRAVQSFVENGGGLLLIGDHTNVFRTGTVLNDIARPLGFSFRPDLLFDMGESAYEQHYVRPWVAHPSVQHLPPMDFAVSCSIDPGWNWGRAAVLGTGLFSMGPDYHPDNFHPVPQHVPEMRVGAFAQVWAARYGKGRVIAFGDSTIFSNFALPQEGKADMMFGMVEWLNRGDALGHGGNIALAVGLAVLGLLMALAGLRLGGGWLLLFAAAVSGWAVGAQAVDFMQRVSLPRPERQRDYISAAVDRSLSDAPLSKGPYTTGDGQGYGLAEQWIQRLGYFVARRRGMEVFDSRVLVLFEPTQTPSDAYKQRLVEYVEAGGAVIVVDSARNVESTAGALLEQFGLTMAGEAAEPVSGSLVLADGWPGLEVNAARQVDGGETVGRVGDRPVIAIAHHGKGAVLAIGCGTFFNDASMGITWMIEPKATVRQHYDVWFALLRRAVEGAPIAPPAPPEPPGLMGE